MSLVDKAHAEGLKIWKKSRRHGWLDNHLIGNTRGKKASKEAFLAGYVMGILHTKQGGHDGQVFREGHEQDATGNENGTTQPRTKQNLQGEENKGVI
jgi:hypothetical protein